MFIVSLEFVADIDVYRDATRSSGLLAVKEAELPFQFAAYPPTLSRLTVHCSVYVFPTFCPIYDL